MQSKGVFGKYNFVIIEVNLSWLKVHGFKVFLFAVLQFLKQVDDFSGIVLKLKVRNVLLTGLRIELSYLVPILFGK